jgi:hypothetical protein
MLQDARHYAVSQFQCAAPCASVDKRCGAIAHGIYKCAQLSG